MAMQFMRKATKTIFISCNALVSVILILGCYGTRINNGDYWFMGLFTLAAFYFLIINVIFLIFWLFIKPSIMLIGIITILICWIPLRQVFQLRTEAAFNYKKNDSSLRVMSWNVEHFDILEHKLHPEKKYEMINLINECKPDIACFQEMVASDNSPTAINYLPDFEKRLEMYEYHFSYNPKLDFDGKHRYGIILFSKYPIIKKETIASNPYSYNSIFQYVDIVKEKDTFRIFNIHLQSLKFSKDNRQYLEDPSIKNGEDLKESKSIINKFKIGFIKRHRQSDWVKREMNKSPYPVIVCGDFNDVPNSFAYNNIGNGMNNAFVEKGSGIGNTFYSISPTLRIDNIFVDKHFDVQQYIRVKKKLSDHYPIITDLLFHKKPID